MNMRAAVETTIDPMISKLPRVSTGESSACE
jgi:hypothetical protein